MIGRTKRKQYQMSVSNLLHAPRGVQDMAASKWKATIRQPFHFDFDCARWNLVHLH
jgi:hypothetical protein